MEYDGGLYIKDVTDAIEAFKQSLSPSKTFGIFHSWGVHQGGNAILGQHLLDGIIHIGGSSYPAARDFYFYANPFDISLDSFPAIDEGSLDSLEEYILRKKNMEFLQGGLDSIFCYGRDINLPDSELPLPIETIMLDSEFVNKISYGKNIDRTPNVPYFVIHCIDDIYVPISLSTNLYLELINKGKNAYALFRPTGNHNWFKNNDDFDQEAYNEIFPKIIYFLKGEWKELEKVDPNSLEELLYTHDKVDIVKQHNAFLSGKKVSLNHKTKFGDVKLNLDKGILSYIERYEKVLNKSEESFEYLNNHSSTSGGSYYIKEARKNLIREKKAINKLKYYFRINSFPNDHSLFALREEKVHEAVANQLLCSKNLLL